MTEFYVYRLNANEQDGDRELAFIADPTKFAEIYDPDVMEFSGVKIVADDPDAAQHVYSNPASSRGDYMICDEPKITRVMGAARKLHDWAERVGMLVLVHKLGAANSETNRLLSEIARRVHDCSNKAMSAEDIYAMLKVKWCQQMIEESEYKDGEASGS